MVSEERVNDVVDDDDDIVARWEGSTKPRAAREEIRPTTRKE